MKRLLQRHLKPYMIRPIIYKAISYFLTALALSLAWDRIVNTTGRLALGFAFTFAAFFFLAAAWINYLRLDGVPVPRFRLRLPKVKKLPAGAFRDMSDYIDVDIVSFEDLSQGERDACFLLINLVCGAIFLALSFV